MRQSTKQDTENFIQKKKNEINEILLLSVVLPGLLWSRSLEGTFALLLELIIDCLTGKDESSRALKESYKSQVVAIMPK